ncbi:MAG TPA: hypothetical protein VEH27_11665, partial [Methylomirabilota bacterium]|nr:hypothetical protein [Methylomirabilota bacterium]
MRHPRKKVFAALLAAAFSLTLLSLDTLDVQPFLRSTYFLETTHVLERTSTTNETQFGELRAGFGRALLTPTLRADDNPAEGRFVNLPLAGYGARKGKPAQGAHDDLWVKAVAFQVGPRVGVIVGTDTLIIPREVADAAATQLRDQAGLERDQIYFGATHTHCSIGGWGAGFIGEAFAGDFNPDARVWFAQQLVAAAGQAIADLKPAQFGHAKFSAPDLVRNRIVGDLGEEDADFTLAVVKQTEGRTAILGAFAAHATVLGAGVMQFSGDYPGYWQRAVEAQTGGMALFLSGSVGSHAPVAGKSGFEGAELMGNTLAERTLAAMADAPLTNQLPFSIFGAPVRLPSLHVRVTDRVRLRPWIARHLVPVSEYTYLQGFRIGNSVWISTPCDFSGELALAP